MSSSINYFENEIACRCSCGANKVSELLLIRLNRLRDGYGAPVFTSSIYSCPDHNASEKGSPTSSHISTEEHECTAADLTARNSFEKLKLTKAALMAGFTRIIFYSDKPHLIHIDVDMTKPDGLFLQ